MRQISNETKNHCMRLPYSYELTTHDRYGCQGQEMDDEVKGEGNSYDFGARMLDPRIGRWITIDPLAKKYPNLTPYNFVGNMPIIAIDPDGKDIVITIAKNDDGKVVVNIVINAKIVNESVKKYSEEQMKVYAERIKNSLVDNLEIVDDYERVMIYDENGNEVVYNGPIEVCVTANIEVVSPDNPIKSSDHVYRLVDSGKIPHSPSDAELTGEKYAPSSVSGYAYPGDNVIYLSTEILENVPSTEGEYAGTGNSDTGRNTLEKTALHETGHSAGLLHPISQWLKIKNFMQSDSGPIEVRGMVVETDDIKKMESSYRNKLINHGTQKY